MEESVRIFIMTESKYYFFLIFEDDEYLYFVFSGIVIFKTPKIKIAPCI